MDQLKEMDPFYEQVIQNEEKYGSAVLEFFRDTLKSDEIVVFTDNTKRPLYKDLRNKFHEWGKDFKTIIIDHIPHSEDIFEFLRTITRGVEPPHLFYKEKYFASSRTLSRRFDSGDVESLLGMEPIVIDKYDFKSAIE